MKKLILIATALLIASGSGVYARSHHRHHGFYGGGQGFYGGARGGRGSDEGRTSG
jgi:hypothetical protein